MKTVDWVFSYLVVGFITFAVCAGADTFNMDPATALGIAVLWPLFAVKYLAIGIWLVLSAGISTLFGL